MATIIPFIIRPRQCPPAQARQGDATIIIFPGIRYEQIGEAEVAPPPEVASTGRGGRKRKAP